MISTGTNISSLQFNTPSQVASGQSVSRQADSVTQQTSRVASDAQSKVAKPEIQKPDQGRDAAEAMRAADTAIVEKPEQGVELDISKQGLEKEQAARAGQAQSQTENQIDKAEEAAEDRKEIQERLEKQQELREKIREQLTQDDDDAQARQAVRNSDQEKATEATITNFAGYTEGQLQQMYLQGKISRNDYESEIEGREEKLEQTTGALSATDKQLADTATRVNEVDRRIGAVNTAFDDDSSNQNNLSNQTRADIVNTLQNQGQAQQTRTAAQEQQQRAFAQWQNDFGFLIR